MQAAKSYQEVQANEAKIFMADTQSDQVDFTQALMRFTVSIVSIIAWGRRISSYQDNVLLAAQAFVGSANLGLPGKTYTEAIPWLARMPSWLNPLPQMLRRLAVSSNKYFYALSVEGAEAPNDNFARRLLREQEEHGLSKVEIANLTGNFIGAGVDTTTSTIITFVLAMCLFPDVQRRAHEEIDAVIGSDRYPDWSDEAQLPYVAALINETFRWRPAFALGGPPHAPTEDDTYNGLFIPKGTSVIGNLYAICRNPREYPDPEQFRPERFMADQKNPPYPNNRGHNAFGWGRRVCAGEPVARQSVYYIVVCLLWAYDIRPGALSRERRSLWIQMRMARPRLTGRCRSTSASCQDLRKVRNLLKRGLLRRKMRSGNMIAKARSRGKMRSIVHMIKRGDRLVSRHRRFI